METALDASNFKVNYLINYMRSFLIITFGDVSSKMHVVWWDAYFMIEEF